MDSAKRPGWKKNSFRNGDRILIASGVKTPWSMELMNDEFRCSTDIFLGEKSFVNRQYVNYKMLKKAMLQRGMWCLLGGLQTSNLFKFAECGGVKRKPQCWSASRWQKLSQRSLKGLETTAMCLYAWGEAVCVLLTERMAWSWVAF